MQYIAIKEIDKNGEKVYTINAIPLKNKTQSVVQKIPHPLGSDILEYNSLEEAKQSIVRAGFAYILPDGTKNSKVESVIQKNTKDYDGLVYETIKSKINSGNSTVVASAILALGEFPKKETFEILFEKFGEENDTIRKNAIASVSRYGKMLQSEIIELLSSENWVTRNSALICIKNISEISDIDIEKFILPLSIACDDSNPIVQATAISTLAQVYKTYKNA